MKAFYACNSMEHSLSRRRFLGGVAGGLGLFGLGSLTQPVLAERLQRQEKRVLVIFMSGGLSQLESWDPKPGTPTGGPFRAIQTSVPGVHISELLPHTAQQMHRMALVRSINTRENNHNLGRVIMETGRRENPAEKYPHLGSVVAKLVGSSSPMPGYIHISPRGDGGVNRGDAAFLGPRYASVTLADGNPPENLLRPPTLSELADSQRQDLRSRLNSRFIPSRRSADTEAYTTSYDQAVQVMQRRAIFDLNQESMQTRQRYGEHDFGRHCLMARRLLENGVTFAKVTHSNYDTHYENFDFHIEQLGEFDRTFSVLLEDLSQRGLLENTLVVVMSEFGRTPTINRNMGRDHWGTAWSVALAGAGIRGGSVCGSTNAGGTAVATREVNGGHMFHTYLTALGFNSEREHFVDGRPIAMADPATAPIQEILA